MFSLSSDFDMKAIESMIKGEVNDWVEGLIERYKIVGKKFVDKARAQTKEEGGFGNITWNLRSSIGCVISLNNKIIFEYFPPIKGGTIGEQKGLAYAQEIAVYVNEPDTVTLVIVAGMEYASLVEARGGGTGDVITHIGKTFPKELLAELTS